MHPYYETLKTAMATGAISLVLDALVEIAGAKVEAGEKERATEIVTLVLCYPLEDDTRERAEELLRDLESELCPRVVMDAKARAFEVTLEEEVQAVLGSEI